jgi:hypothetical protein
MHRPLFARAWLHVDDQVHDPRQRHPARKGVSDIGDHGDDLLGGDHRVGGELPMRQPIRKARATRVAELTGLLDLSSCPKGMRVIGRKERPHRARSCGSPTSTGTGSAASPPPPAPGSSRT